MAAGNIRAGRAFVEIGSTDTELQKGLKSAQKKLQSFAGGIKTIGIGLGAASAAIVAPLTAAVTSFANIGDTLQKAAARTGVGVSALSELKFAAEQSGAGITEIETAIKGMNNVILDLERGLSTAVDSFGDLGLTTDDFVGLNADEKFSLIAEALSKVEDEGRRSALAVDVFGRAGTKLLPLLEGGAEGMEKLRQEARDLGITLTEEDANAAAELTDKMNELKNQFQAITVQIGSALAPVLTRLANAVTDFLPKVIEFIKQNRSVVVTVAGVGVALGLMSGAALTAFFAVSALAAVVGFVATPFGLAAAAVALFGLALAGIGLVVLDALGTLDILSARFGDTFKAIAAAVRGGNLTLAFKIAFEELKLIVLEAIQVIRSTMISAFDNPLGRFILSRAGVDVGAAKIGTAGTEVAINAQRRTLGNLKREAFTSASSADIEKKLDALANPSQQQQNKLKETFKGGLSGVEGILNSIDATMSDLNEKVRPTLPTPGLAP